MATLTQALKSWWRSNSQRSSPAKGAAPRENVQNVFGVRYGPSWPVNSRSVRDLSGNDGVTSTGGTTSGRAAALGRQIQVIYPAVIQGAGGETMPNLPPAAPDPGRTAPGGPFVN